LVTGAARGLGRAYALRLAKLGAKVAVTDLDLSSYAQFEAEREAGGNVSTVDQIKAMGEDAIGFEFDISDPAQTMKAVDEVRQRWGRTDVLVANAGGGRGTPEQTKASVIPPELLEIVTQTNLYGTVNICRAVAPIMKEQRRGKIVTVASYGGLCASSDGGYAHYGAIKAAIAHYTRYLAQELGPFSINANCVAPGIIGTARILELWKSMPEAPSPENEMALRRVGTVEECAGVVEFLTTSLSDYVTGTVIAIDGGWNRAS
jgi:3-oxoacyl-[acyl-carrier protein] reductase